MKRIITLCFFVLAFAFGTQNIVAQDAIKVKAQEKTEELRRTVKFNDTQKEQIFEVLTTYYKYMAKVKSNDQISNLQERKDKITNYTDEKVKTILTEEQFEIYKKVNL